MKHIENETTTDLKKKKKATPNLLKDSRFKALFENPDFQVDVNTEEYALLNPVISQMGKMKKRKAPMVQSEDNTKEESDAGKNVTINILLMYSRVCFPMMKFNSKDFLERYY